MRKVELRAMYSQIGLEHEELLAVFILVSVALPVISLCENLSSIIKRAFFKYAYT